ncbi:MAG TPA: hypothetical protein VK066_13110 [Chloroflexota bacterium]|nr:hypothetical protein [Chloroflexota bacterium]
MAREDESLDEVPGRLTHVIYNTALGHVRVRAEDGPATTVEVPPGEVRFRRVLGAAEPEVALWLGSGERDYLGRMLEHVLRALRITPEARVALEAVQAKLEGLGPPPVVADDGESADAAASVPIVEEPPPAPPPAEATVAPESAAMPPEPARARSERGDERGRGRAAPRPTPAEPPLDDVAAPQPPTRAPAGADANGAEPAAPPAAPLPADSTEGALLAPGADAELLAASQAAFDAAVAADSGGQAVTFEQVWRDLTALQARGPALQTLAGQASSEIREVTEDGVWLYMQQLGRHHLIERRSLEAAWSALVRRGQLVSRELRGGMSYGAATLLAHLPYVEYSAQPLTLYYPASTPHPLGTVHRRDVT